MKYYLLILFFVLLFTSPAQDTTRILFIGNSFTYANNMPQMFQTMADTAHISVVTGMHAPGGVSVGDTAQGAMAHMNNPTLFALIRSQKWDFAVIQDNQGRFVEDSAVFPSKSMVVQGHLNIMDSVKANNSCAKIILFAGWGWKNGYPQLSNTGIGIINRILINYVVLNDTMKEVVAPIGEAWKKAVNYLPSVNLWDADDAHPSYAGSYLTASVIFSTIFDTAAKTINYNGALNPSIAYDLRAFADSAVFTPVFHNRYNLGGIEVVTPQLNNGQLSVSGNYLEYSWYKDDQFISHAATLVITGNGQYKALLKANDGSIIKTCDFLYSGATSTTGFSEKNGSLEVFVFPNPVTNGVLTILCDEKLDKIELISISGQVQKIEPEFTADRVIISTKELLPACYFMIVRSGKFTNYMKVVVVKEF
jgi:hypothetical protein